jgi:drug/metabolite transporter (DMT)-like permease
MITFIAANKLTTSANAVMLQYSAPVWAALLGWLLLKEKPYWEHWGALVLVIIGLLLFFRGSLGGGAFLGDSLAVVSGIVFGAQSVSMRMMKDGNPRDAFLLSYSITLIISIPFLILYPPVFTPALIPPVLFMGFIQIGAASLLFSYGIKRISAVKAMITAIIEPVLSPIWVLILIGEKPTISAMAGGIIIISAVAASSVIGRRREERQSKIAKTGTGP